LIAAVSIHCEHLTSIKVGFFRQHDLNDEICAYLYPLFERLVEYQSLQRVSLDAGATDDIVEQVAKMGKLTEMRITNCPYVAGAFLH
jgi:hypothetical protein